MLVVEVDEHPRWPMNRIGEVIFRISMCFRKVRSKEVVKGSYYSKCQYIFGKVNLRHIKSMTRVLLFQGYKENNISKQN